MLPVLCWASAEARHPDRGGGRQAPDNVVGLEDHPGAQEPDAGDDLRGDP